MVIGVHSQFLTGRMAGRYDDCDIILFWKVTRCMMVNELRQGSEEIGVKNDTHEGKKR